MENIKVSLLKPNEKNPRNSLGDLTELVESIKANGVMQNLTVVPDGKKYTVVIGHRRLEAAKLAGLKEVPCEVKELSLQDQAQIMLMENMQRNDLTVTEQAKGFQTCLDLGLKEVDIAKKTGLSKATISNRIKLTKFDLDKVQKGIDKGATIDDFIKLTKLKDKDAADKLLECIGTSSFGWRLEEQITNEKRKVWKSKLINELNELGINQIKRADDIYKHSKYRSRLYFPAGIDIEIKKLCQIENIDIFYINDGGSIEIRFIDHDIETNGNEDSEENLTNIWEKKNQLIKPYLETAYQLRTNFMKEISKNVIPEDRTKEIYKHINEFLIKNGFYYSRLEEEYIGKFFEIDFPYEDLDRDEIIHLINSSNNNTILLMYLTLEVGTEEFDLDEDMKETDRNEYLTYKYLKLLGYEMSPEEQQLYDGTHPVYKEMRALEE